MATLQSNFVVTFHFDGEESVSLLSPNLEFREVNLFGQRAISCDVVVGEHLSASAYPAKNIRRMLEPTLLRGYGIVNITYLNKPIRPTHTPRW